MQIAFEVFIKNWRILLEVGDVFAIMVGSNCMSRASYNLVELNVNSCWVDFTILSLLLKDYKDSEYIGSAIIYEMFIDLESVYVGFDVSGFTKLFKESMYILNI